MSPIMNGRSAHSPAPMVRKMPASDEADHDAVGRAQQRPRQPGQDGRHDADEHPHAVEAAEPLGGGVGDRREPALHDPRLAVRR